MMKQMHGFILLLQLNAIVTGMQTLPVKANDTNIVELHNGSIGGSYTKREQRIFSIRGGRSGKQEGERRNLQTANEQEPTVYSKYNPLEDAKCFNEAYAVPNMTTTLRQSLYTDYVKIFRWGLLNPTESTIYAKTNDLTSNTFAHMCIRLAFNDNTINNRNSYFLSAQEYVAANIEDGWWSGPAIMETSGGDASNLICPYERLHPTNNRGQAASRVLHAFQSSGAYPRGPGITNSTGNPSGLIKKYDMSYADALHNCALAAITFLTESPTSVSELPSQSEFQQSDAANYMVLGRLDACHITSDPTHLSSVLEYNNRVALCGNAALLPDTSINATSLTQYFLDRGMAPGAWVSLFGTHTTSNTFGNEKTLRNLGVPTQDYFADYVGCSFIEITSTGECLWQPQCASDAGRSIWPLVSLDCSVGEFYSGARMLNSLLPPLEREIYLQIDSYVSNVGAWVPDAVCALMHLGGPDDIDCVGPNAVNSNSSNSLFGSVFTQNPYSWPMPSDYVPRPGEIRLAGYNSRTISVGSDGTLLSADPLQQLWKSNLGEGWTDATSGKLIGIAVVGDNQYYGVGTDHVLYQWSNSQWNRIGHDVKSLSASWDGTVVTTGLGNNQQIYYKTGYNTNTNWGTMPDTTGAIDVAVVGGGTLYYILSNGDVYRTTSYDNKGLKVGSNATNIAASKDGTVVMSTSDGRVFRKVRNDDTLEWESVQHSLGTGLDIAVKDQNNLFIISESDNQNSDAPNFIYHIFMKNLVPMGPTSPPTLAPTSPPTLGPTSVPTPAPTSPPTQAPTSPPTRAPTLSPTPAPILAPAPITVSLSQVGHGARTIAAASDRTLATANLSNNLWKSDLGSGWSLVPGTMTDVAVVQNGWYYVIGSDTHIYRMYSGSNWVLIGHNTVAIAASWDGTVTCINKFDGRIWTQALLDGWYETQGVLNAKDVALVGGGLMYYIASNGDIYRTTNYRNPGVKVGWNGVKISAGKDGTVVAVVADGTVWQKGYNDNSQYWFALMGITAVDVAVVDNDRIFVTNVSGNIYRVNK